MHLHVYITKCVLVATAPMIIFLGSQILKARPSTPVSEIYGIEHLLRLFGQLYNHVHVFFN